MTLAGETTPTLETAPKPSLGEMSALWAKIGLVSFGGPAAQIALMQSELVDRRGWLDRQTFLNGLNLCMLLPGPEAQQLATYAGWRSHGPLGGLIAGSLFVLPGALILLLLSWIAARHGDVPLVAAIFAGIKPVVVGIIAAALWRLAKRTMAGPAALGIAIAAFIAIAFFSVPFPAVIAAAALLGVLAARMGWKLVGAPPPGQQTPAKSFGLDPLRIAKLCAVFAAALAAPVALIVLSFGAEPFFDLANLFTKAAFITFGGAYALLPYIAGESVATYGWLEQSDMIRGLALAEAKPGPLILVNQFVGFFAGWNEPGALSPLASGLIGAGLVTYVTFLPSFLFIFALAPAVDKLQHVTWAQSALAGVTAAVVGVIANLGVIFGGVVLVKNGAPDFINIAVALASLYAMIRYNLAVHWIVLAGAALGIFGWTIGIVT
jgi:chromate transporter